MTRQYVRCKFNPWDRREYTYHFDGPPVAVGDKVEVESRNGRVTVEVMGTSLAGPSFDTKPILGLAPKGDA